MKLSFPCSENGRALSVLEEMHLALASRVMSALQVVSSSAPMLCAVYIDTFPLPIAGLCLSGSISCRARTRAAGGKPYSSVLCL